MNPQPEEDIERRLQQLEVELNTPLPSEQGPQFPRPTQTVSSPQIQLQVNKLIIWFNSLPNFGKLIVVGLGTLVSFAILQAVLNIVVSAVSLGLLGVLLYLAYKFFVAHSSRD